MRQLLGLHISGDFTMSSQMNHQNRQVTIGQVFAECVLLMAQSERHAAVPTAMLPTMLLPAIQAKQFHLFRDGSKVVAAAIWACLNPDAEKILSGLINKQEVILEPGLWASGDRIWLMDLIAPHATTKNHQAEIMTADLIAGPLKGKSFKVLNRDPACERQAPIEVPSDAADRMKSEIVSYLMSRTG